METGDLLKLDLDEMTKMGQEHLDLADNLEQEQLPRLRARHESFLATLDQQLAGALNETFGSVVRQLQNAIQVHRDHGQGVINSANQMRQVKEDLVRQLSQVHNNQ